MNKLTLVLALFLCTSILFAQKSQDFTISGKVVDKAAGVPLEYATITVKDRNNAQDVEGGITDPSGNFSVSVPAGDYSIKIEYISFQPIILQRSISEDLNLGTI